MFAYRNWMLIMLRVVKIKLLSLIHVQGWHKPYIVLCIFFTYQFHEKNEQQEIKYNSN